MKACALGLLFVAGVAAAADENKVAITTASDEARAIYLRARDLQEKLRGTDANAQYKKAIAKDAGFALAHYGVATSATSNQEFFASLERAVALKEDVSEGERLLIEALEAGATAQAVRQRALLEKLAARFPKDERAQTLLGNYHFGTQNYPAAIAAFERAIAINPAFSQPYNQLGYAYRFLDRIPEAERAFRNYILRIPDDPNPYDSYGELLMKLGRFKESVAQYEKALAVDPNFIPSHVGIALNRLLLGHPAQAGVALARLTAIARNDGERRQALFWTAMFQVDQGSYDPALATVEKMAALARASGALNTLAGDYNLMGQILLEAGRLQEATARFKEQLELVDSASVPVEVKQTARRNHLFNAARVALADKDLATAKKLAAEYARQVEEKKIPFEQRQQHELFGRIALAQGDGRAAVAQFKKANTQDPRVLFLLASGLALQGDDDRARALFERAAHFNGLSGNYAYVRTTALRRLADYQTRSTESAPTGG